MQNCRIHVNAAGDEATCFVTLDDSAPLAGRTFVMDVVAAKGEDPRKLRIYCAFPKNYSLLVETPAASPTDAWCMGEQGATKQVLAPVLEVPMPVFIKLLDVPLYDTTKDRTDIWTRVDTRVLAAVLRATLRASGLLEPVHRAYCCGCAATPGAKFAPAGDAAATTEGVVLLWAGTVFCTTITLARSLRGRPGDYPIVAQIHLEYKDNSSSVGVSFVYDKKVFGDDEAAAERTVRKSLLDCVRIAVNYAAIAYLVDIEMHTAQNSLSSRLVKRRVACHCCLRDDVLMDRTARPCPLCRQGIFCLNCLKDDAYLEDEQRHSHMCRRRFWSVGVDMADLYV